MPRIVPSQVVSFIDQLLPWLREGQGGILHKDHSGAAAGLVSLVDSLPGELLTLNSNDYNEFVASVAALKDKLPQWQNQQNPNLYTPIGQLFRGLNPVTVIRQALLKCPDEGPSATTSDLAFISDVDFRATLRRDLGAIDRALANGEWKATTVLAGAAIEALLLWALRQTAQIGIDDAIIKLLATGEFKFSPKPDLETWDLFQYAAVSESLGIIKPDCAAQVNLAREFRNLIHPGRAQRLGQICDRATALSAVAGVEHVIRNLTVGAPSG